MTLRARLAIAVGVIVAAVLVASGVAISAYTERVARDSVDDRLRRTAGLLRVTTGSTFQTQRPPAEDRRLNDVLDATGTSLRLFVGDFEIESYGPALLDGRPPALGLRTVSRGSGPVRVLVEDVPDARLGDIARLETAASLTGTLARQDALDRRLLALGAVGVALTVLATTLAATGVLAPLRRLRRLVGRIASEGDLEVRVSETDGPGEVRALAGSFNRMLARLDRSARERERALAATRRFAADAGHELRTPLTTVQATLSALHRHPDVPAAQRGAMLADALDEQARLVTLLDGLQAFARGDAAALDPEPVDLGELLAEAAGATRSAHPDVSVQLDVPGEPVVVSGWPPGLRLLVGNLADNAARYGAGTVRLGLIGGEAPVLTVIDDGPGIPAGERERVLEPFVRLQADGERPGTGLGLALVAQQVRAADASLEIDDAPGGGARFTVRFPVSDERA